MEIKNHMLVGENVKKPVITSKTSGEFGPGKLDTVVVHYTAGPYKPSLNTLTNPRVKASAHLLVDRDGTVTQLVPFNLISWHAGKSSHNGRVGMNNYSIGIEIVNSGPLTKSGNVYRTWFGSSYDPSDVIEAIHRNETTPRYWHVYTQQQIQAIEEICMALIEEYNIKYILGHEEIAPKRKTDPGPAFPLDRLRNKLLEESRDADTDEDLPDVGRIAASSLNIRALPKNNADKIALPLTRGTKVKILDEADGWYKVSTEIEGWVFGKHVDIH